MDLKNSAGGQQLRIKTSVEALSKISDLIIVSRNIRYEKSKKLKFLKNKNFYFAPSVKKIITKSIFNPIIWRIKEFNYLKKDAEYLVNLYKKYNCSCIWISYASQSYQLIKQVKKIDPSVKIISDTDSVFYKFLERKIPYVNFFSKIFYFLYSKYFKLIEKKMLLTSNIITTVSEHDKTILKKLVSSSKIMIFRNAVNNLNVNKIKHKGFNILISGTFGEKNSPMNVSTRWFIQKILPKLKSKIKNLTIFVIGMNSTKEFNSEENLIVKDWVDDISKYFLICDLAAVPLKYESGTRFKILEAGIFNLPVVSTTLGAEGLEYKNNKNIIIADTHEKFLNRIVYLYNNPKIRKEIARNNKKIVSNLYSLKNIKDDGLRILNQIN